jgi:Ca-activated chloride channel family protein
VSFASPAWLFGLLALPAIALLEALVARRDAQRAARFVARPLWARVVRRPAAGWRWARLTLLLLGTAGLVTALARPEWGVVREKVEREGVDVVMAIDTSGSMATEDLSPSRFFIARNALQSLVGDLDGDRIGLLAFEGEAYPLVPLTLDADAVGLFLETLEPGIVPSPGSSLGVGLAKGLEMFVDKERRNKALVLVSDGEDLEGDVEDAIRKAKEAGVVVHTVGVGTERGQPVPDFDREGNRTGFKKDESGSVVVSRLHAETLEAMARGTGGTYVALSPTSASLASVAAAIEGMERKTLAREWSYRKRERYQVPLGIALACFTLALLLPPFPLRRGGALDRAAAVLACGLLAPAAASAADAKQVTGEVLLKPKRLTQEGRGEFERGNHPAALQAFEKASQSRPDDPAAKFNLADGLYKNGKLDEAAAIYEALGASGSRLAPEARFNLGNTRFQKQDFAGAAAAYKDALRLKPGDRDTINNLEMALRALQQQKQDEQKQQDDPKKDEQDKDQQRDKQSKEQDDKQKEQKQDQKQQQGQQPERPKTEEEKEKERFQKETGMPKERAMQLLDALQQNEKDEQKRLLAAKAQKKTGKDW